MKIVITNDVDKQLVKWPVRFIVPVVNSDTPGEKVQIETVMSFRLLPYKLPDNNDSPEAVADSLKEHIKETIVGWDDTFTDVNGAPLPYSRDNLELLLSTANGNAIMNGLMVAWREMRDGQMHDMGN